MNAEADYLAALRKVLILGSEVNKDEERTGTGTRKIHNVTIRHDMSIGFPAVTSKRLAFNAVKGELIRFLEGASDAARFRELGCNIWDSNANDDGILPNKWLTNPNRLGFDDMGRVYGVQARDWTNSVGATTDQLANMLKSLKDDNQSRRMYVTHANPGEVDQQCLPPCHLLYQVGVMPDTDTLDLTWYQRSCDAFLGAPFNIASYGLLLELLCKATGFTPGILTGHFFDFHIYDNHVDQVKEMLSREPYAPPKLRLDMPDGFDLINYVDNRLLMPGDINLENYYSHGTITAPMAV